MAKRFTDTEKYKKHFIRNLPAAYKIFWDYLYHDCDHAGIWYVDMEVAQIRIGKDAPIDKEKALELFNQGETRIYVLNGGRKWFIKPFVEFQYGVLNPNNRVHQSVIEELKREGAYKYLTSPIQGAKDKDKDIDKDKDKDKDIDINYYKDLWNEKVKDVPTLPKIRELSGTRRKHLRKRLEEKLFRENFTAIIDEIIKNDFLSGKKPSEKHPNFKADFDWLIVNDTNYLKILEGKYRSIKREKRGFEKYLRED